MVLLVQQAQQDQLEQQGKQALLVYKDLQV
jgi:hypothetical protein